MESSQPTSGLNALPEELKLLIISFLDIRPPSEHRLYLEPSITITQASNTPLKALSSTSKHWRDLILPVLFRHFRLQLDPREKYFLRHTLDRTFVDYDTFLKADKDDEEEDSLLGQENRLDSDSDDGKHESHTIAQHSKRQARYRFRWMSAEKGRKLKGWQSAPKLWLPSLDQDYLTFILRNDLARRIETVVIQTDQVFHPKSSLSNGIIDDLWASSRYHIDQLWNAFFEHLRPLRLTMVAPPSTISCLFKEAVSLDSADFFMPLQLYTLSQDTTMAATYQRPATDSYLLLQQAWNHFGINEGSYVKSYGTYEYHNLINPGPAEDVLNTIACIDSFFPSDFPTDEQRLLSRLKSFSYTAIFPNAPNYFFRSSQRRFPFETVRLKCAPDPSSGLLDQPRWFGSADRRDCWLEFLRTYIDLSQDLWPSSDHLETIICDDYEIVPELADELDDAFSRLEPGWHREGTVWKRDRAVVPSQTTDVLTANE